ncbi:MAG: MinD/ParA family protein [Gammaproteobacteria bacterium]|nr:MinD/ParA family protein [Gammaproteobacteria bacterium]
MQELNTPDQAQGLRELAGTRPVKVIAVTGGKGGVGKTSVSVNMGVALAEQGKKVMILDADLGLANVDVMLGLKPVKTLQHVFAGECGLEEVLLDGPMGVKIVPAASGTQSMVALSPAEHAGLIRAFSSLSVPVDVLIVDTAAGIADSVISFTQAAQDVVVVVCDEPTSITDAYALIKILNRDHDVFRFRVVANMTHTPTEGRELFAKLTKVTDKFLDVALDFVGAVPYDENARKAIKRQKPIVELFPRSPASLAFRNLAARAASWPVPVRPGGHIEFFIERLVSQAHRMAAES